MTEQHSLKESTSALMDGQASELELRRILKATEDDVNTGSNSVRETWKNYHLIGQAMRSEITTDLGIDISNSVRAALVDEPDMVKKSWVNNVTKMAIAASVAGFVVLTSQMISQNQRDTNQATLAENKSTVNSSSMDLPSMNYPAGFGAPSIPTRTVSGGSSAYSPSIGQYATPQASQKILVRTSPRPSEDVQLYLQRIMTLHAGQAALNGNRGVSPYYRSPQPEK